MVKKLHNRLPSQVNANVQHPVVNLNNYAFFKEGLSGVIVIHLFSMISFFVSKCPNRSGAGAIDNPD